MFGKAKDVAKMLQNAKSLQKNMEQAKQKLTKTVFTAEADGITISVAGDHKIIDINIGSISDPKAIITAIKNAHNNCLNQIATASEQQIKDLSKDLDINELLKGEE